MHIHMLRESELSLMRVFLVMLCIMLPLSTQAVSAENHVRVLLMDKGFQKVPQADEELKKLEEVSDGRLILGYSDYMGRLVIWLSDNGLYLVNDLPLEQYVAGVVKAEIGSDWAAEAMKAQAVIVRTYVLSQVERAKRSEYHVTSSVLHQVFRGKTGDKDILDAVEKTRGEILTWEGRPIVAFYHSTTDGMTEVPEEVFGQSFPYLKSVSSSGRLSPFSLWTRTMELSEIASALQINEKILSLTVTSRTSTGRVGNVTVTTAYSGDHVYSGNDFRRQVGWKKVPSTDFNVSIHKGTATIKGKGFGHGVGLSQWSALEMALDGKTYREILEHFYPGAQLTSERNASVEVPADPPTSSVNQASEGLHARQ